MEASFVGIAFEIISSDAAYCGAIQQRHKKESEVYFVNETHGTRLAPAPAGTLRIELAKGNSIFQPLTLHLVTR
jgi:hypothetical protein